MFIGCHIDIDQTMKLWNELKLPNNKCTPHNLKCLLGLNFTEHMADQFNSGDWNIKSLKRFIEHYNCTGDVLVDWWE